ncbi:MAG: DNA mismatch repair endonuclease MutL [Candidatus Dormibacteria bacterium]
MSAAPSIRRLPQPVADAIAAGEVVERPASVVKELLENAVDAGAGRVEVVIEGGGAVRLRVSDDGRGIAADQLELAVARHATSKISEVRHLERIASLGFRGEALASIAAVSELTLSSRVAGEAGGARLRVRGGELVERGPWGAPVGTTVEVCDLFFNTPARLRFLRQERTEVAATVRVAADAVLASPAMALTCVVDGRRAVRHPGGDLREALASVLGAAAAAELLEVTAAEGPVTVLGAISQPRAHRATRAALTLVVNGRRVHNRAVLYAVEEAYRGLLPGGRHPYGLVAVSVDPGDLDVNVHPTKREVRFREERAVLGTVQRACWHALGGSRPYAVDWQAGHGAGGVGQSDLGLAEPSGATWHTAAADRQPAGDRSDPARLERGADSPVAADPRLGRSGGEDDPGLPGGAVTALCGARAVGQVGSAWLVAEGAGGGLLLIDPHAAHEKVLYAELLAGWADPGRGGGGSQLLLLPAIIPCDPGRLARFAEVAGLLAECGFEVDSFGPDALRCRAVPAASASLDVPRLVLEVLDTVGPSTGPPGGRHHRIAALVACHAAVRLGDSLSLAEQQRLLDRLAVTPGAITCPHGRPTVLVSSDAELRRAFGRP